jgi:hypothetical protein
LGRCRFHFAEALFSRRTKLSRPAFWARGLLISSQPKMLNQRLQLTYYFVKE